MCSGVSTSKDLMRTPCDEKTPISWTGRDDLDTGRSTARLHSRPKCLAARPLHARHDEPATTDRPAAQNGATIRCRQYALGHTCSPRSLEAAAGVQDAAEGTREVRGHRLYIHQYDREFSTSDR